MVGWPRLRATAILPRPLTGADGKTTNPNSAINKRLKRAVVAAAKAALKDHKEKRLMRKFHKQHQKEYKFATRKPKTMEIKRRIGVGLLRKKARGFRTMETMKAAPANPKLTKVKGVSQTIHNSMLFEMKLPMRKGWRAVNKPGALVSASDIVGEIEQWSERDERRAGKIVFKGIEKFWRNEFRKRKNMATKYRAQMRGQGYNV